MVRQFSKKEPVEGVVTRVMLPRGKQVLGEIVELLGASRFTLRCSDDKTRVCRIPGKFRKRVNVRVGDIALVEPWDIEPDTKGDIVWVYNKTHARWLRDKGHI